MVVRTIVELLDADIIHGVDLDTREIRSCCGSDMMSDVLAYVKDQPVLLTGLCNPQVIRTAEMMDIMCIAFVRGKRPDEKMIELAKDRDICLLATKHTMFTSCGILFQNGLIGGA